MTDSTRKLAASREPSAQKKLRLPKSFCFVENSGATNNARLKLPEFNAFPETNSDLVTKLDEFIILFDKLGVPDALRPTLADVFTFVAHQATKRGALPSTEAMKAAFAAAINDSGKTHDLAALPSGLNWPDPKNDDYGNSPEAKRGGGGIVAYLTRVWLPILEAGRRDGRIYVDRRRVEANFPQVTQAMRNYQRPDKGTGERRVIPDHLHFPTIRQVNDHILASHPDVARIAANRAKNGIPAFGT